MKVALLGAAMLALAACNNSKCEACKPETCILQCKVPTKKETVDLMLNTYDKFLENSKFSVSTKLYHGTETTMDEEPYNSAWLEGENASGYLTFTCSEKPAISGLRWNMETDAMWEYGTSGWQSSTLEMNKTGGFGGALVVGMSFARISSAWESVNNTLSEQTLENYDGACFHVRFKTNQSVDITYFQSKDGPRLYNLEILAFFSTYYVKNTIEFTSFGECVMDEVF